MDLLYLIVLLLQFIFILFVACLVFAFALACLFVHLIIQKNLNEWRMKSDLWLRAQEDDKKSSNSLSI